MAGLFGITLVLCSFIPHLAVYAARFDKGIAFSPPYRFLAERILYSYKSESSRMCGLRAASIHRRSRLLPKCASSTNPAEYQKWKELDHIADLSTKELEEIVSRNPRDVVDSTRIVTYSRKVFIPLTRLCRDKCQYCTYVVAILPHECRSSYLFNAHR
jgi:hypothetical protein